VCNALNRAVRNHYVWQWATNVRMCARHGVHRKNQQPPAWHQEPSATVRTPQAAEGQNSPRIRVHRHACRGVPVQVCNTRSCWSSSLASSTAKDNRCYVRCEEAVQPRCWHQVMRCNTTAYQCRCTTMQHSIVPQSASGMVMREPNVNGGVWRTQARWHQQACGCGNRALNQALRKGMLRGTDVGEGNRLSPI